MSRIVIFVEGVCFCVVKFRVSLNTARERACLPVPGYDEFFNGAWNGAGGIVFYFSLSACGTYFLNDCFLIVGWPELYYLIPAKCLFVLFFEISFEDVDFLAGTSGNRERKSGVWRDTETRRRSHGENLLIGHLRYLQIVLCLTGAGEKLLIDHLWYLQIVLCLTGAGEKLLTGRLLYLRIVLCLTGAGEFSPYIFHVNYEGSEW